VLRSIFGPKGDEMTGRKLHNDELRGYYSSQNIIRIIKPRRMWTGHVARTEKRNAYRILVESQKKRDH
jgi:hypothetical protein